MVNERLLRFFQASITTRIPWRCCLRWSPHAAFYDDTTDIHDPRHREIFAHRIIAKLPTIAAAAYKHSWASRLSIRVTTCLIAPICSTCFLRFHASPTRPTRWPWKRWNCCSFCMPTMSKRQHLDGAVRG